MSENHELAAIDVGYGNTKYATISPQGPDTGYLVSNVEPARQDLMPSWVTRSFQRVEVDGRIYEVGRDVSRRKTSADVLNQGFIHTTEYMALFYAALQQIGARRIHRLVTGLPLTHFTRYKDELVERLQGEHTIARSADGTPQKAVISHVTVVPQPFGGFADYAASQTDKKALQRMKILVVDPGHYSLDWLYMHRQQPVMDRSGTHTGGMHWLLEETAQMIEERHGLRVPVSDVEDTVRDGDEIVMASGQEIPVNPLLRDAAERIGGSGVQAIRNSLGEDITLDRVLIVGGGSACYRELLAPLSPGQEPVVLPHSLFANVRGYAYYGQWMNRSAQA